MKRLLAILLLSTISCFAQSTGGTLGGGGGTASTNPDGTTRTASTPTSLFYDGFETSFDTGAKWNSPTAAGGGVAEAFVAGGGAITLGSGTTANGFSFIQSQVSYQPVPPGFVVFEDAIKFDTPIPANVEAFWGFGTSTGSPTAASPITEGCGFEIQASAPANTAKMFAVCFAGSARTNIQDLSAATGNNKQPTDGNTHVYFVYFRGDRFWFAIDSPTNIVAQQFNGANGPNVNTQPLKIQAVAGTINPVSSFTLTVASVWVGDSGSNGVYTAATGSQAAGIQTVQSTATESGHVLKSTSGNFYGVVVTSTVNGLVMIFNSATVPVDGAVTPIYCFRLTPDSGGSGTASISFLPGPPAVFTTGISVAMSTGTNCANKTASVTAWITGLVK